MHICRKTKTDLALVRRYEPNIILCPREMDNIIHNILYDSKLHHIKSVVKEFFFRMVLNKEHKQLTEDDLHDIAISSMIEYTLLEKFQNKRTRSFFKEIGSITEDCKQIRKKRIEEEKYLKYTFKEDFKRSLGELNFVLDKYNKL